MFHFYDGLFEEVENEVFLDVNGNFYGDKKYLIETAFHDSPLIDILDEEKKIEKLEKNFENEEIEEKKIEELEKNFEKEEIEEPESNLNIEKEEIEENIGKLIKKKKREKKKEEEGGKE